jgi:hypothetical protein
LRVSAALPANRCGALPHCVAMLPRHSSILST